MPTFKFKGEMLRHAMRQRWVQNLRDRGAWRSKRKPRVQAAPAQS